MAELTTQERLQPSLLDRLIDDEPDKRQESRDRRVLSLQKLRDGVIRDLSWLLNTTHLAATDDLAPYPEVARSVLNYGVPELTGVTVLSLDPAGLERRIRQAIWDFEPRILRNTAQVRIEARDEMSHNAMTVYIEGEMWAQPVPLQLYLKTEVDLETSNVELVEYR